MERLVCIHGHFYQPDRRDPVTGELPVEPGAAPFHDWNERIDAECYRPNAAARLLDDQGRIAAVTSNYERISWNVGPTLLAWLEEHDDWTYRALLEADAAGAVRFGGHGPAMAQPWVHAILPLATERDRATLVRWGIADFERRFGRAPEGMWLPETAVDTPTLEALAAEGIAFTVLAPWQADAPDGLDTTRAHRVRLPSGGSIAAYFYDGAIAAGIAFQGWLEDGAALAARMVEAFGPARGRRHALVHAATDGESYGHHHRFGEMALARALAELEADPGVALTVYGHHLATHRLSHDIAIAEPTAWSCAHGIERWRSDCGCQTGGPPDWHQAWRAPPRDSLDWLRDELAATFEEEVGALLDDPWAARDDYEAVLAGVVPAADLVRSHGGPGDAVDQVVGLLEVQRHALSMFESSAWFFNDAAGLEPVLALRHDAPSTVAAGGAGVDLEAAFLDRLAPMTSNDPAAGDGRRIWAERVRRAAEPSEPTISAAGDAEATLEALRRLATVAAAPAAERDRILEAAVRRQAEVLATSGSVGAVEELRSLLAVARSVAPGTTPGLWWVQNAVVAAGRGRPSPALRALAVEVGVALDDDRG